MKKAIRYHGMSILVLEGTKQVSYVIGTTHHKTLQGAKLDVDGDVTANQDLGVQRKN